MNKPPVDEYVDANFHSDLEHHFFGVASGYF